MLSTKNQLNTFKPTTWIIDLISLAVFLGTLYALWIGSYALFTPDEGRYSEVAREMVATGDYITPRVNGVAFLDKPVLYYWLQASAIQLFGLKEWALRFWPACIGIIGALITYMAGHLLFNRRTGILSAIILAASPLYYGAAHYANLDLEVAVFVSAALLFFIMSTQVTTAKARTYLLITAYVFAGLAALTKGLIGIVFPAMIIGAWILLLKRWEMLKKMHLISGLLIFAGITIPWYILVQMANPEFFQFFFIKQQVSRFLTTEQFNNRTVTWFYIPIVLVGLFPWCSFVFQALTLHIKNAWKNRQQHSSEFFLLLWFFLVFVFFSIPKSKTVGYILPVFPPIALLIGSYLSDCWEKPKTKGIYYGMIAFLTLCAGLILGCLILPTLEMAEISHLMIPYLNKVAILFLISGIVITALLLKKKQLPVLFTVLTATMAVFLVMISASGSALNQGTIKPLAAQVKPLLQPTDEIVTYFKYYQDLPIYLERRITIVTDWKAADIPLKDNWVRELWYGITFQDTKEWLIDEISFWYKWHSGKRLFVFTDKEFIADLKVKSKLLNKKVYTIAIYNDIALVSNHPVLTENPELSKNKVNNGQNS